MEQVLDKVRDNMRKATEVVREDIGTVRSGRANPQLVAQVTISAYGGSQKLKLEELATITSQDSKTLVISPFDPSIITEIEKGIQEANIGLTPVIEGEIIRITIPLLTEERRKEYIKLVRVKLEGGRVMIRQHRQEGMKNLKKLVEEKTISDDQQKQGEKKIQELTDEMIAEIDGMGQRKEAELLAI